tara:strand:- start:277 stop:465 length:189 start_codon:yes stop_codon:yes gene_type:complete
MTDFETHPIGTQKRLDEMEAALRHIVDLNVPEDDSPMSPEYWLAMRFCPNIARAALLSKAKP